MSMSTTTRRAQAAPESGARSGVVVRLDRGSNAPSSIDPDRLARAVEDLIRAIDPTLAGARVQVEVTAPGAILPTQSQNAQPQHAQPQHAPTLVAPAGAASTGTGPAFAAMSPAPPAGALEPAPDLGLDLAGRSLLVDGQVVVLTRREFDLLAYLQQHRGVALSRQQLMTAVWKCGYLDGDRTIDVHVRRLRIKLGPQADRLTTLRGYGYRLD